MRCLDIRKQGSAVAKASLVLKHFGSNPAGLAISGEADSNERRQLILQPATSSHMTGICCNNHRRFKSDPGSGYRIDSPTNQYRCLTLLDVALRSSCYPAYQQHQRSCKSPDLRSPHQIKQPHQTDHGSRTLPPARVHFTQQRPPQNSIHTPKSLRPTHPTLLLRSRQQCSRHNALRSLPSHPPAPLTPLHRSLDPTHLIHHAHRKIRYAASHRLDFNHS